MSHKPKNENIDITNIRTSPESHTYWKKHFHENPLFFRLYAVFEADIGSDNSSIGKKQLLFISKPRYSMVFI